MKAQLCGLVCYSFHMCFVLRSRLALPMTWARNHFGLTDVTGATDDVHQ